MVVIWAGGVLPGELLKAMGVESHPLEIAVTVIFLLGLLAGGLKLLWSVGRYLHARWRARGGEGKRRLRYRRLFASMVERRIFELNNKEEWADWRFTELEAEVETLGDRRSSLFGFLGAGRGLRRERSLSRALRRSKQRLILLQGDPGSGKSVALRFIAAKMAGKAMRAKRVDAVIPIYVNLKELRSEGAPVDAELIESFVLGALSQGGDRNVDEFLEKDFALAKEEGSWFFLFDSFDEIPEVLSATEVDETVRSYSDAITTFITGWGACRGVIASRYFRAPPQFGLPTYRLMPLSEKRKRQMIRKADIGPAESQLLEDLESAPPDLAALSANPLFLGLLTEFVRSEGVLPTGWHDVFEAFVSTRIETDREKVRQLFGVDGEELRRRSEEIAFTMTASDGLGLSPTRDALAVAFARSGFTGGDRLEATLDALQWIKLARSEVSGSSRTSRTFTFAHRRFQEYFATCVVLRDPDLVPPRTLLTDASWRETAVTICHAQPQHRTSIVDAAEAVLLEGEAALPDPQPGFRWNPGALHVLSLLQSAFAGRTESLPASLRQRVAAVVAAAEKGTVTDRKWALEVAGTIPEDDLAGVLLAALKGNSDWLREVAYRQLSRLSLIPAELAGEIRRALILRVVSLRIQRDWPGTRAQVMRLRPPEPYLRTARLLRAVPLIDAAAFGLGFVIVAASGQSAGSLLTWFVVGIAGHLSYYPTASAIARSRMPNLRLFRPMSERPTANLRPDLSSFRRFAAGFSTTVTWVLLWSAMIECRVIAMALLIQVASEIGVLAPSLVLAYLVVWSLAVTALLLVASPGLMAVLLAPLSLILDLVARVNRRVIRVLLLLIPTGGLMVLVAVGIAWLPSIVVLALTVFSAAVFGLLVLSYLLYLCWSRLGDALWLRRWRRSGGIGTMDSDALLDGLVVLRSEVGRVRFLREVRVRRALRGDGEAAGAIRDLLLPGHSGELAPGQSRSIGRGQLVDELGRLLEDLERGEEIPVA